MSEPTHKKLRIVKLLEILQQDTDLEHHMGTNELLIRLNELGFKSDRHTMTRDIDVLNSQGYEVMLVKSGKRR